MSDSADRGRTLRFLPAMLLVATACFSILGHAFLFSDPTTQDDWKRAAAHVSSNLKPTTMVRVEPTWTDAPLVWLTSGTDRINRNKQLIAEDQYGFANVLVLAETDRVDRALERLGPGASQKAVVPFGTVSVLEATFPTRFSWSAHESLQDATLERVTNGSIQHCTKWDAAARRWDCDKVDQWVYVRDMIREVGNEPRQCVFMHPVPGKTVRLTFNIPAGRNLVIRAGLDLRSARSSRGTDVTFRVRRGEEVLVDHLVPAKSNEWARFDVPVSGAAALAFEVETEKIFERFFCFDAWLEP